MAKSCADTEAVFKSKPAGRMVLDDEIAPFGPSAKLEKLEISSIKPEQKIEKAYYDTDLKSKEAVLRLYSHDIPVSQIQKSFSVGLFGIGRNRKFVPTRWSITAVDDTIANMLLENTKQYPFISEYRVYESSSLDNHFAIVMLPREWCFEMIEAWHPQTIWNTTEQEMTMISSHEFYNGRKTYAEIGGSYYSAKLAVNEQLNRERRQAGVVIFREIRSGYIMPVGVWNIREAVRLAMKGRPVKFASLKESLDYACQKMLLPLSSWLKHSTVLKDTLNQRKLTDFYEA